MSDNPLQNFYRNKEIYVRLPTQGKWYANPPKLTADGEIGVYPMTVKDEILLNIPDSLYNSESLFELFKSICPDIPDPYEICMPDVDVILLASRAATYLNKMRVGSTCTHCETFQEYEIDLAQVLSRISYDNSSIEVEIGEHLAVGIKPNTLKTVSASNIQMSNTAKLLANMKATDVFPEEIREEHLKGIQITAAASIAVLADAVEYVEIKGEQRVTDYQHIVEWISNSDKRTVELLQKQLERANANGLQNSFSFKCEEEECGKDFKGRVEFNPAFFFSNNWHELKMSTKSSTS